MKIVRAGRLSYPAGLELQTGRVEEIAQEPGAEDVLILLEHEPVYTMGRNPDRSSLPDAVLPHPLHEINRGGQATWHGPGQLVGYPIVDLRRRGRDLHAYLRALEDILIRTLERFGVTGSRRDGMTGVWVEDRKIASIGVGVRKWVAMHGFALNVCNELEPFRHIVPCGIAGVKMTTLADESGRKELSVEDVGDAIAALFEADLEALLPRRNEVAINRKS